MKSKRVRFNEQVQEKLIPRTKEIEEEEDEEAHDVQEEEDGAPTIILAGATMEELVRQMEPGTMCVVEMYDAGVVLRC